MKSLCQKFTKSSPKLLLQPFFTAADPASKASLAKVAQTFVDLQEERHSADYDLAETFSRSDALNSWQRAHDAVLEWNGLVGRDREFCRFFALLFELLAESRIEAITFSDPYLGGSLGSAALLRGEPPSAVARRVIQAWSNTNLFSCIDSAFNTSRRF